MANPGPPPHNPTPGGNIPSDVPPTPWPDEELPDTEPTGPRAPSGDTSISEPKEPGSEPDYLPGGPTSPGTRH